MQHDFVPLRRIIWSRSARRLPILQALDHRMLTWDKAFSLSDVVAGLVPWRSTN